MAISFKGYKSNVEDLILKDLSYQVGYKFVGHMDFFKTLEVRDFVLKVMSNFAIENDVIIYDININDYSVVYKISTDLGVDIKRYISRLASTILRNVNKQYPELKLKSFVTTQTLVYLWHRPYFITTIDNNKRDLTKYLL